jgi:hypothetical protein
LKPRKLAAVFLIGTTVFCGGLSLPAAYADDPPPVDDPSGTVVDVDGPAPVTQDPGPPDAATPPVPGEEGGLCYDKDWKKYKVTSKTTQFLAKSTTFQLVNDGNVAASQTFAAGISASLALSVTAGVTTEASVIVAGVKASGTAGATATITVSGTYSVTATARPHTTGYAAMGFFRTKTGGTYTYYSRYCNIAPRNYAATAYTPYRFGGRVWGG